MQWPYPAIAPVPLQHSPKFSDKHPWSALIIFALVLSAKDVPDGQIYLIRTPSSALISTQFYHILPFFFFKVLSVYLTFQAISSRCSFKESRPVLVLDHRTCVLCNELANFFRKIEKLSKSQKSQILLPTFSGVWFSGHFKPNLSKIGQEIFT